MSGLVHGEPVFIGVVVLLRGPVRVVLLFCFHGFAHSPLQHLQGDVFRLCCCLTHPFRAGAKEVGTGK